MTKSVAVIDLETLSATTGEGPALVPRDFSLFGHVNVRVTAEIGHADISIEQLLASKAGEVLTLLQTVDTPLTLLVSNKPIARGQLVAVGDNFGVQITEIV